MKQIWKYTLQVGHTSIKIPEGYQILSVQAQCNKPCLWALVDPKAQKKEVVFKTFGTGHTLPAEETSNIKFIGTYQLDNGVFVAHVFQQLDV